MRKMKGFTSYKNCTKLTIYSEIELLLWPQIAPSFTSCLEAISKLPSEMIYYFRIFISIQENDWTPAFARVTDFMAMG